MSLLARARLKKRFTDDRLIECEDGVEIGRVYQVLLDTRQMATLWNAEHGVLHEKEIIFTAMEGWLPTEMLDIEAVG